MSADCERKKFSESWAGTAPQSRHSFVQDCEHSHGFNTSHRSKPMPELYELRASSAHIRGLIESRSNTSFESGENQMRTKPRQIAS